MLHRGAMAGWGLRVHVAAAALAVAASIAARARADAAEPIQLVFEGHGCGSADEFRAQVLARTARATFVTTNARRTFRVTIAGTPPSGSLVIVDAQGKTTERRIGSAPCDALVEALALVSAIAIDPAASTKPIAELAPAPPPVDDPEPGLGPFALAPIPPPDGPSRDEAPPAPSVRFRGTALAQAGVLAGPIPGAVAHFGAGVGVERDAGVFSQELRFTVAGSTSSEATAQAATARFSSVRLDLSLTPIRFASRWVRVAPVVAATLLAVNVSATTGVSDPQSLSRWVPFAALGARGTLDLGPAFVELEARASVPLVRERYYIDPTVTVFESSVVAFDGSLGVGVRFP